MGGSFTRRKVGTWDRLFNFPSEGRQAEDFYIEKIQRFRPGLNPQTREPEASMLTTRPPKPFYVHVCVCVFVYTDSSETKVANDMMTFLITNHEKVSKLYFF
jgi:hypothetical protein